MQTRTSRAAEAVRRLQVRVCALSDEALAFIRWKKKAGGGDAFDSREHAICGAQMNVLCLNLQMCFLMRHPHPELNSTPAPMCCGQVFVCVCAFGAVELCMAADTLNQKPFTPADGQLPGTEGQR